MYLDHFARRFCIFLLVMVVFPLTLFFGITLNIGFRQKSWLKTIILTISETGRTLREVWTEEDYQCL